MKKSLNDFAIFEIEKSQLDKVVGGKKVIDGEYSGSGADATSKGCYPNEEYCCVQEFLYMYDDGTWSHDFVPCEYQKPSQSLQGSINIGNISSPAPLVPQNMGGVSSSRNNNCGISVNAIYPI